MARVLFDQSGHGWGKVYLAFRCGSLSPDSEAVHTARWQYNGFLEYIYSFDGTLLPVLHAVGFDPMLVLSCNSARKKDPSSVQGRHAERPINPPHASPLLLNLSVGHNPPLVLDVIMNHSMWQESSVIRGNCNHWIYRDFSLYGQYKPASLQLGIAVSDAEPHGISI